MSYLAKTFIIAGLILVISGLVIYFSGNKLNWIGRLPGDIRIERDNFRFYFPITTMILFSLLATGLVWIIKKFF